MAFSRAGTDLLDDVTPVPALHDGMAAFGGRRGGTKLVRNHEIEPDDVEEGGVAPVPHVDGHTYDPQGTGGTTTLVVDRDRAPGVPRGEHRRHGQQLRRRPEPVGHVAHLRGDRHGHRRGEARVRLRGRPGSGAANPAPITALGRFEHEAVLVRPRAAPRTSPRTPTPPFGQIYRFRPRRPRPGRGAWPAGGELTTLRIPDLDGTDLSAVTEPGTVFRRLKWVRVDRPDVEGTARPCGRSTRGTPIQKAEGTWWGDGGDLVRVVLRRRTAGAEDEEDRNRGRAPAADLALRSPARPPGAGRTSSRPPTTSQGRTTSRVGPHGYAVMCTDGDDDDQFLAGITERRRHVPAGPEPAERRGVRRRLLLARRSRRCSPTCRSPAPPSPSGGPGAAEGAAPPPREPTGDHAARRCYDGRPSSGCGAVW